MIGWAVALFAVAALGGVTMVVQRMGDKPTPMGLALVHGVVAAAGLVLLLLAVIQGAAAGLATVSLGIFVLAALGGFVLFAGYLRSGTFPLNLALGHGALAVVGFVLLLVFLLG